MGQRHAAGVLSSGLPPGRAGEVTEMKAVLNRAKSFLLSEDGPTAAEYAVMVALIIIAAVFAIQALGINVRNIFQDVGEKRITVVHV
jgi:pilus assembly protein Flp/PilA